jgi:hypothetical protein
VSIVVEYDDAVVTYQSLADSRLEAAGALAFITRSGDLVAVYDTGG